MSELVEHTIEVDEYTNVTLKIPKVLTPIELKSLMMKANKLFNLSEVPMRVESSLRYPKDRKGNGKQIRFTEMQDTQLFHMKTIAKKNYATISTKMNLPEQKLKNRVWYLKNQNKWNKKFLGSNK